MKDQELERILKSARVPEPGRGFWNDLPRRVIAESRRASSSRTTGESEIPVWTPLAALLRLIRQPLAVSLCLALLGTAFFFSHKQRSDPLQQQAQRMRTYLAEVSALFPGQVRSIISSNGHTEIVLADSPSVPPSSPILLRISGPDSLQTMVTFSGQEVEVGGEPCEVLLAGGGEVLVVGRETVWSSKSRRNSGDYRIDARIF